MTGAVFEVPSSSGDVFVVRGGDELLTDAFSSRFEHFGLFSELYFSYKHLTLGASD